MANTIANPADLKKELEKMINDLVKRGVLKKDTGVQQLMENVLGILKDKNISLSPDHLKDKEVQKALTLICITAANPALANNDVFKNQLKALFTQLLKLTPEEKEDQAVDRKLNFIMGKLAKKISEEDDADEENNTVTDSLTRGLSKRLEPNPGVPDPLGIIMHEVINAVAENKDPVIEALEKVDKLLGIIENCLGEKFTEQHAHSPFKTHLTPRGEE